MDYVFPEQAPGTELIDKAVIDGALNYIVRNQGRQGQLPIVGRVHNFGLLVCTKLTHYNQHPCRHLQSHVVL